MDTLIYILFVSIFVPILLMALLVERKSRLPIVFVLIGIFISVLASEINGLFKSLLSKNLSEVAIFISPFTEEVLKALPVLFFALVVTDKKEKLFTASMACGIGFAILENVYYLLQHISSISVFDAIVRVFGSGLMHGMCTLLIGVGISFVKEKRKIFFVGTFALLSTAIIYHSIYNMLIQSSFIFVGALLPIATYIPFFIWRIKKSYNLGGK